jgi:hypothetical protein
MSEENPKPLPSSDEIVFRKIISLFIGFVPSIVAVISFGFKNPAQWLLPALILTNIVCSAIAAFGLLNGMKDKAAQAGLSILLTIFFWIERAYSIIHRLLWKGRNLAVFFGFAVPSSTAYGWLMLTGIFVSIIFWSRLARRDERLVMIYISALIAYGIFRFFHEFLRDTPQIIGPFSGYQFAALGVAALGVFGFVVRRHTILINRQKILQ